jgi:transposase
MLLTDGNGLPLGVTIAAANHAEVKLIESLVENRIDPAVPKRLIYDKAADSDPLRKSLHFRGTRLICPHRRGRKHSPPQDQRVLKRYRHRWKVERSIAWLHNYRRIVTRYEHYAFLYHGFVQMACMMVILKQL